MESASAVTPFESETSCVRQWFMFPPVPQHQIPAIRLRSVRIVIETAGGQLVFASMKSRLPIDPEVAEHIARLLDHGNPYSDRNKSLSDLDDVCGHLVLLNSPIDAEKSWLTPTILAEFVLDKTLTRIHEGQIVCSSHRKEFIALLKESLLDSLASFIAGLDPQLLLVSRSAEGQYCRPSTYNFFIAKDAKEPHAKRNRLQAVGQFQFLLPMVPIDRGFWWIVQAIDSGRPLIEALAHFFSVPASVVKSLHHQSGSVIGAQWSRRPDVLLQVLAMLPPNARPRTPEGWDIFNQTSRLVEEKGGCLTKTFSQLWLRAAMAQGCRTQDIRELEMETAAHDIDELCTRVEDVLNFQIAVTGVAASHVVRAVVMEMKSSQNPIRLARIAQKWRRAYIRESHAFSEDRELWVGMRWQPLLDEPFEGESRRIVALTDFAALREEGELMSNCVETYANNCRRGESQIWSCRSHDGSHCSTVETVVLEQAGKCTVKVIQHKGPNNIRPSDSCRETVGALTKFLEKCRDRLATYVAWRVNIASRALDERTAIAFFKPIISALETTLSKQWTLDKLRSNATKRIQQESAARMTHRT